MNQAEIKYNVSDIKLVQLSTAEAMRRLERDVGPMLVMEIKRAISKGPGGNLKGMDAAGRKAARATLAGLKKWKRPHSKPGDAPFTQTGFLKSNIAYERESSTAIKVGVNSSVIYAHALEYGYPPRNLLPRPYIRPTVRKNWGRIRKLMGVKD